MRNPLKKLQKKVNVRLASKAAQHSQKLKSVNEPSQEKKPQHSESTTSLYNEQEDPLFDKKGAPIDSDKANQKTEKAEATPKKKKKRGRLSFGGRKSIGSLPKKGPLHQEPETESCAAPNASSSSPKKSVLQTLPRPEDFQKAKREAPRAPPSKAPVASAQEPESPDSPSSNLHIPAPPNYQTPTRRPDPAPGNSFASGTAKDELPKQSMKSKAMPPQNDASKQNEQVIVDPNIERIAKAAAALDNTGNEAFERGEYDKAMAIYARALKLKKRTLNKIKQPEEGEEEAEFPPEKTPMKPAGSKPDHKQDASSDELWISVATSINNIGYLKQQSGQASAEETMQAYQNSLQIKRRVLGKDNLSVGKTLNNLGTVHYLKRDYAEALKAYQEALEIMKASLGAHHLDVGTVHSNIGDVYWAQSGDTKFAGSTGACPQRTYQASRDSALRHYRHSLEIRWEQLQDHHDPKVIRLLEKIAALEMGESFLALVQTNRKYRPATIGENGEEAGQENDEMEDEAMEKETSKPPVEQEMQNLHEEVRKEVKTMDLMERKMAIDMVKDKLRLIREMKNLSNLDIDKMDLEELSLADDPTPRKSPLNKGPLSPVQRTEALSAVKTKLHQIRECRKAGTSFFFPQTQASSDLKEIDGSPTHYTSQKASNLLNRINSGQPLASYQGPSDRTKGLDDLRRNFLLEGLTTNDSDGKPSTTFSPRTSNTLNEGIGALRSLSLNSQPETSASWLPAPSTPPKPVSPTTPLPSASAASF